MTNSIGSIFEQKVRDLFRIKTLPHLKITKRLLGEEKISLVDVGATGNPKGVWREAEPFSRFVLFDPDPRAELDTKKNAVIFPIGLWSSSGTQKLHLATNPEASSLFEFNIPLLGQFQNSFLNTSNSTLPIKVDSLDNIISESNLNICPDFLKVDAEGADLEILKGAENVISSSCLGIFIETSFRERHINSPFFADIDSYLRSKNFSIFDIYPERWININGISSGFSRHQLIWSDALYFISSDEFISRIKTADIDKREIIIKKYIFLLTLYQFHDYAISIVELCTNLKLTNNSNLLLTFIKKSIENTAPNLLRIISSIIISLLLLIPLSPFKTLYMNNKLFLRIQFGEFCNYLNQFSAKRYVGCVADTNNPASRI